MALAARALREGIGVLRRTISQPLTVARAKAATRVATTTGLVIFIVRVFLFEQAPRGRVERGRPNRGSRPLYYVSDGARSRATAEWTIRAELERARGIFLRPRASNAGRELPRDVAAHASRADTAPDARTADRCQNVARGEQFF